MYKHNGFIADPVDTKIQLSSWIVFLDLFLTELDASVYQIACRNLPLRPVWIRRRIGTPDRFKIFPAIPLSMRSRRAIERISYAISCYGNQSRWLTSQFDLVNCERPFLTVFSFTDCHGISAGLCYRKGSCNENKSSQRLRRNESHFIGFLLFFRRHSAVLAESGIAQSVIFVTGSPIYLSHSKSNVAERVSAKSCHASVRIEQFNFFRRKARFTCRETLSSKDIKHIYSNVGQSRQVGTIGVSITLLIFSLCIAIDSASLAHFVLAKFQSLPLFTQAVA